MKNKIIPIIIVAATIIIVLLFLIIKPKGDNIPNDYIAIFNGGSEEITYSTYIYKIDNGQANMGFKYINTVNTTVSWGSPEWEIKITDSGEVTWTDDVFPVAKKHGAYSYVKIPNDDKTYTIEEFQERFLMN
jgi:hypothetical protein